MSNTSGDGQGAKPSRVARATTNTVFDSLIATRTVTIKDSNGGTKQKERFFDGLGAMMPKLSVDGLVKVSQTCQGMNKRIEKVISRRLSKYNFDLEYLLKITKEFSPAVDSANGSAVAKPYATVGPSERRNRAARIELEGVLASWDNKVAPLGGFHVSVYEQKKEQGKFNKKNIVLDATHVGAVSQSYAWISAVATLLKDKSASCKVGTANPVTLTRIGPDGSHLLLSTGKESDDPICVQFSSFALQMLKQADYVHHFLCKDTADIWKKTRSSKKRTKKAKIVVKEGEEGEDAPDAPEEEEEEDKSDNKVPVSLIKKSLDLAQLRNVFKELLTACKDAPFANIKAKVTEIEGRDKRRSETAKVAHKNINSLFFGSLPDEVLNAPPLEALPERKPEPVPEPEVAPEPEEAPEEVAEPEEEPEPESTVGPRKMREKKETEEERRIRMARAKRQKIEEDKKEKERVQKLKAELGPRKRKQKVSDDDGFIHVVKKHADEDVDLKALQESASPVTVAKKDTAVSQKKASATFDPSNAFSVVTSSSKSRGRKRIRKSGDNSPAPQQKKPKQIVQKSLTSSPAEKPADYFNRKPKATKKSTPQAAAPTKKSQQKSKSKNQPEVVEKPKPKKRKKKVVEEEPEKELTPTDRKKRNRKLNKATRKVKKEKPWYENEDMQKLVMAAGVVVILFALGSLVPLFFPAGQVDEE